MRANEIARITAAAVARMPVARVRRQVPAGHEWKTVIRLGHALRARIRSMT
jgi:hypothetical protein